MPGRLWANWNLNSFLFTDTTTRTTTVLLLLLLLHVFVVQKWPIFIMPSTVGKGAISVAFVRLSVCSSVCLSVAYIANNSRTQRPSMPKFGKKVSHRRCDSHISLKVKRSKVRVGGGRGHTVSAEPGGHTACFTVVSRNVDRFLSYLTLGIPSKFAI